MLHTNFQNLLLGGNFFYDRALSFGQEFIGTGERAYEQVCSEEE